MPLNYSASLGALDRWKNDMAFKARRKIFATFMRECAPGPADRVADFGVSGHREHPVHYFFESLYPYKDHLTAIGREAEDAQWYPRQFPGLTFVEADLRSIPLPDNHFEAGICNAVVEHAGTREQQAALVREVCRVSRRVLFTTPNRAFPVELHTFLPFAHWLPDPAFRALLRRIGHSYFAEIENLNPLDTTSFKGLFPADRDTRLLNGGPLALQPNLLCVSSVREQGRIVDAR
ncbi:MAG: class I SAM-dependent methyltransferase [Chloroflexi bacterium]|nr:class I SAM-dependent methyltransferase [Chloroflexota bacterium]